MVSRRRGVADEPEWCKVTPELRHKTPDKFWPWLIDTGSLTERLKSAAQGTFQMHVLQLSHERPMWSERQALQLPDRQQALVRHVLLSGQGKPWVFARTVIPVASLKGALRHLAHLGDKPLGGVLFSDKSLFRSEIKIAACDSVAGFFSDMTACLECAPDTIWGRRSVFKLKGQPLLVSEFFLPDIPYVQEGCQS